MHGFARRGLVWILALALVVAGLPMAHAMPADQASSHAATDRHAELAMASADHAHHHDGMAMDAVSDQDHDAQDAAAPCKCLNCSMCAANFVAPPLRPATPERRIVAVTYRLDAVNVAGIAVRIDPGIPILAA